MDCNERVEAIIVLYNPDLSRFYDCIESVCNQVKRVIVVDNNSKNSNQVKVWLEENVPNATFISLINNFGIGFALNRAIDSLDSSTKWVLTLDQDSIVPQKLVQTFRKHLSIQNLAVLCPRVIDMRRYNKPEKKMMEYPVSEVSHCIQSGSLFNVNILRNVGGFNEWLFIDYVDYEYCYRVIQAGYKIYRVNDLVLNQEFGNLHDSKFKNIYLALWAVTKINLFKKLSYVPEISNWRMFYTVRNRIYCLQYFSVQQKIKEICVIPLSYIKIIFRSQNKISSIKAIMKGVKAGVVSLHEGIEVHKDEYL